ncbi:MAG TPA: 4-hydroxy-3-methylbut-2-enyl diphosphate reductase [Alphaproteobacteria bacterium]|jgi:4-hydroxy-3-methylbut-2-enyl diphosphate reductase|nr:4-hydroxy-3-methylbut-2-enyl diphosphate reductase [Alphaproteobacteria bacterium]
MELSPLTIVLAGPRGFCAGVDRAIQIVERALELSGAPVYVRHEIVHNRFVVEQLEAKGAIFVHELDEVPEGATVVFSAHGVPKAVPMDAERRGLNALDATCPLVSKVHREAERHHAEGRQIILIGHGGHPEVEGTVGQLPPGAVILLEDAAHVGALQVRDPGNLAYCTQTTLSVDETEGTIAALKTRFPNIAGPRKEDICYATTNRQAAVKAIAGHVDALMVIGAPNSSNSSRLVEVAKAYGCERSILVSRASEIDWRWFDGVRRLGLTAGASAPEILVEEVVAEARKRFAVTIEEREVARENVTFKLPAALNRAVQAKESAAVA